jgi:hypothetical protein
MIPSARKTGFQEILRLLWDAQEDESKSENRLNHSECLVQEQMLSHLVAFMPNETASLSLSALY